MFPNWRRSIQSNSCCNIQCSSSQCNQTFNAPVTISSIEDLTLTLSSGLGNPNDTLIFTVPGQAVFATAYGIGGFYTIPAPEGGWEGNVIAVEMRFADCPPKSVPVKVVDVNCAVSQNILLRSNNIGTFAALEIMIEPGIGTESVNVFATIVGENITLQETYNPAEPLFLTFPAPSPDGWSFSGPHVLEIQFGNCPPITKNFTVIYNNTCLREGQAELLSTVVGNTEAIEVLIEIDVGDVAVMVKGYVDGDDSSYEEQYYPREPGFVLPIPAPQGGWGVGIHTANVTFGSCSPIQMTFTVEG